MTDTRYFNLGELRLASGEILRDAKLAYAIHGSLSNDRANCVVLPSYYAGTHVSYEPLIGPDRALDPDRWFIVVPNMFGNGLSSSPSLMADALEQRLFPRISVYDNVMSQRRLLTHLGVERVAVVGGWSLGAIQSYHWAVMFPDFVDGLLPFCGTASCWPLNQAFLQGLRAILHADPAFASPERPLSVESLRAFGRVYASWAYSAQFFRDELYRRLGYETLEHFLTFWEDDHANRNGFDLLAMLWTWENADIGKVPPFAGDRAQALSSIRAQTIVMPCDKDLYFTLEEAETEARHLARSELRPFHSPYGHCAGAPGRFPEETNHLSKAFHDLLRDVRGHA